MIEKKLLDLLSLLESHARDATPKVPMVPRPPTPALLLLPRLSVLIRSGKKTQRQGKELLRRGTFKRRPPRTN